MQLDRVVQRTVQAAVWGAIGLATLGYCAFGIWALVAVWRIA